MARERSRKDLEVDRATERDRLSDADLDTAVVTFPQQAPKVALNMRIEPEVVALARKVGDCLEGPLAPVAGTIFAAARTAQLPLQPPASADRLAEMAASAPQGSLAGAWARQLLTRADLAAVRHWPVDVQVLSLGRRVCLVALPGEPVAELGRRIRAGLPGGGVGFVLGCTNGLKAYLPTDDIIREGGYEVEGAVHVYNLPAPFATTTVGAPDASTASRPIGLVSSELMLISLKSSCTVPPAKLQLARYPALVRHPNRQAISAHRAVARCTG